MDQKEIILSKIASIFRKKGFLKKNNSEFKARLKCTGLLEYYEKYSNYLIPYNYVDGNNGQFQNSNMEFDIFLGLDGIFSDLYHERRNSEIILLLKELTKSFDIGYIEEYLYDEFEEVQQLYALLGLSIEFDFDVISVSTNMASDITRVGEMFSVENWLKTRYKEVYDSYTAAIDAYTHGHIGTCIEACRTCMTSLFSVFKGTESYARWIRGVYHISNEKDNANIEDLKQAINTDLKKEDLADFFCENRAGKLTKTKMVYMIFP